MNVDELAHRAEVEAEVLRAVSHMGPTGARDFLMAVALKIHRAHSNEVLATPTVLDPGPTTSGPRVVGAEVERAIAAVDELVESLQGERHRARS